VVGDVPHAEGSLNPAVPMMIVEMNTVVRSVDGTLMGLLLLFLEVGLEQDGVVDDIKDRVLDGLVLDL
jgi:hypothetical protein